MPPQLEKNHVVPTAWQDEALARDGLEFPRETSIILRCAGKAGNTFHTKKGNRPSCRGQEGRRGSEEAVPGPSVFPSREPGVSGDTSVFLPGASHGQGSLVGHSPCSRQESDTTEQLTLSSFQPFQLRWSRKPVGRGQAERREGQGRLGVCVT